MACSRVPAFEYRHLPRELAAARPRGVQRVPGAARFQMHREQAHFLRAAGIQAQLDTPAHVVAHRQIGEVGRACERQTAPDCKAIVLYRDASREAEPVVGEHEPRRFRTIHFLQRDDVGIERARMPLQRGDVFVASCELVRDVARHRAPCAIPRRIRGRARGRQGSQSLGCHEPFEIPGGDLEFRGCGLDQARERQQQRSGSGSGTIFHAPDYRMVTSSSVEPRPFR